MNARERFLGACKNQPVDRPPVWIMRQAGRTLPEYLALREKHSFWEICTTPELAAQVSLQPVKRFQMDAAIIFSDILVVPAAMGLNVQFSPEISLSPLIKNKDDLAKLKRPEVHSALGYVEQIIKDVNTEVKGATAVLGFSGAPYTLASYMIEGGRVKNFLKTKAMLFSEPALFKDLMKIITEVVGDYLEMQIEAKATAIQLFDSWAGELAPEDFENMVLPFLVSILERLKPKGVPIIYYINGIGDLLEPAQKTGADALSIDWRIRLSEVRKRLGPDQVVQGNLDPSMLLAPKELIKQRVFEMLAQTGGKGHIVNLGHGLLAESPLENIETFVTAVREWAEKNGPQK